MNFDDEDFDDDHSEGERDGEYLAVGGRADRRAPDVARARKTREAREAELQAERDARSEWTSAAALGLGFLAIVSATFLGVRDSWSSFASATRFAIVAAVFTVAHVAAAVAAKKNARLIAQIFECIVALMLGASLALLARNAPTNMTDPDFVAQLLRSGSQIVGLWAIGSFAYAASRRSSALHFIAVVATIFWLVVADEGWDAPIAIVFCIVGEFWAHRRRSVSVAILYGATAFFILATERALWTPSKAPILTLGFAVLIYWAGLTLRNAVARGASLVGIGSALAVMSLPKYWRFALENASAPLEDALERVEDATVATAPHALVLALAFAASFALICFCVNLIITGAARSKGRYFYGIALFIVWIVVFIAVAQQERGNRAAACALIMISIVFGALFYVEKNALARSDAANPSKPDAPLETDGADDDPDFDDPFDREIRETRDFTPVGVEAARQRLFVAVVNALVEPAQILSVVLHFALLFVARRG